MRATHPHLTTPLSAFLQVPGLLSVGTDGGRVMLFNPKTNKLTAQKDGKHPGKKVAVVAGDYLRDGRLACASGERMKVSAPITEDPAWATFAKFYISGMVNKIPISMVSTTKTYDSTPGFLAVSLGSPPYIAMTLGDKVRVALSSHHRAILRVCVHCNVPLSLTTLSLSVCVFASPGGNDHGL